MKDFITKKHIYEIILIIATSVLLGLVYNALNPKKLPLIYKPAKIEKISNDELFGPAVKQTQEIKTKDKGFYKIVWYETNKTGRDADCASAIDEMRKLGKR